jgi:3-oxoacyl-[acyl-carrier-protein] synthase III
MHSRIESVGIYIPQRKLTNPDLIKILAASGQETSNEWILERTGITQRRIAEEHETVESMAVEAAVDAVRRIKRKISPIEHILVATNSAKRMFPNVTGFVQAGLIKDCPDMIKHTAAGADPHAGCGGINVATMYADALIRAEFYETVLVIGVEKLSAITDYSDRATCVLFGDGASAYVVTKHKGKGGFMGHEARASGVSREIISCEEGTEKVTFFEAIKAVEEGRAPRRTVGRVLRMDGRGVYRYVETEWKQLLKNLQHNKKLNPEGITFSELAAISPHLANYRMFSVLDERDYPGFLKKCGLLENGKNDDFFNNSTASQGRRNRRFLESAKPEEYLLCFGYGAELCSCANLYKMPED